LRCPKGIQKLRGKGWRKMQQLKEQFEENLETWWSIEYYSTKKMSPQLQPFPGASECLIYERDTPPP